MDVLDDFNAWAIVSARLRKRTARQVVAVLAELGLAEIWPRADAHWRAELVEDLAVGDMERAFRYSSVCAADLAERPPDEPPAEPESSPSDFRHDALYGQRAERLPSGRAAASGRAAPPPSGSFRQELGGDGAVVAPAPGQHATAPMQPSDLRETLAAAKAAINWPVETYAAFHAELEVRPGQTAAILERYKVNGETTAAYIHKAWQSRLAKDPALAQRWGALVLEHRQRSSET